VQVIDYQDEGAAGRRELGHHVVDHGLAVELGCRGQGLGAAGRGPGRAQQHELEQPLVGRPGRTDIRAIRWSWPGRPAHACSSDVLSLPAGAEMIVAASRPRDPARLLAALTIPGT
jgi:hypothetical protein